MNNMLYSSRLLRPQLCALTLALSILVIAPQQLSWAQLPTIELFSISPSCAQTGSQVELTLNGSRLEEVSELRFIDSQGRNLDLDATSRLAPRRLLDDSEHTTNVFDISIPPNLEPGLIEVRAIGRFGVSNPRPLLITSQPVEFPRTDPTNPATPLPAKAGSIIVDQTHPLGRNHYSVTIGEEQQFYAVAYTEPIDSQATLLLALRDRDGREVASGRSIGPWPAELFWSEPGEYTLEARDLLYQGGPLYSYLIELRAESSKELSLATSSLNQLLRPSLPTLIGSSSSSNPLATRVGSPTAASHWNSAEVSDSQDALYDSFPVLIAGSFLSSGNFNFRATKGQSLVFDLISNSFNQLTDPRLVIYRVSLAADGTEQLQQVAEQDDLPFLGNPALRLRRVDPQLQWTANDEGNYRAVVFDNVTGDRPADALQYRLQIRSPQPSFSLLAYPSFPSINPAVARPIGSQILAGGTESIHIIVLRQDGFNEAVEVSVADPPPGMRVSPMIVPAGAAEGDLILEATEDCTPWTGTLHIQGTAQIGESQMVVPAQVACHTAAAVPTRNSVRSRLVSTLEIGIQALDQAPVLTQLGNGNPLEATQGAKISLPIRLVRRPGGNSECTLRPQNLPTKVTLGETKIAGDQSEAVAELAIAADAPTGEYTFWLQNETKVKWKANPQALEREEAYLAKLKKAAEMPDPSGPNKEQLDAAIAAATAQLEKIKTQTNEQEYTVWFPSQLIRLRILPSAN